MSGLTCLCEFCLTFRTGNADTSFSLRNTYLLTTGWATVDMVCLSLRCLGFETVKLGFKFIFRIQIPDVLLVALLMIFR